MRSPQRMYPFLATTSNNTIQRSHWSHSCSDKDEPLGPYYRPCSAAFRTNWVYYLYPTIYLFMLYCWCRFADEQWGLTTVQLLDVEMHFLSSHHWQPRVLAVQLAQSENRKHCSSVLSARESQKQISRLDCWYGGEFSLVHFCWEFIFNQKCSDQFDVKNCILHHHHHVWMWLQCLHMEKIEVRDLISLGWRINMREAEHWSGSC